MKDTALLELNLNRFTLENISYFCDFVVRDIKIAVYLESPRKINFNLVSDFLNK